ncbi:response regulator [Candidatus Woesearchaeota archaeon]|nr:response regulator [Candidatus Woesearchaeota archaeon]
MIIGDISVLLIETGEDPEVLGIYQRQLQKAGITALDTAISLDAALNLVSGKPYHLVISNEQEPLRKTKELRIKPVCVGLGANPFDIRLWKGFTDYYYTKRTFYPPGNGLQEVLQKFRGRQ